MSNKQARLLLGTIYSKALAKYFPDEPIDNRLMNWLYLYLALTDREYDKPFNRYKFSHPESFINELSKNDIRPELLKAFRYGMMFEKHYFDWFEESEVFYQVFKYCIFEQRFPVIQPIVLNRGIVETCIMLFDGIDRDRETKYVFLLNTKNTWNEFRAIIKTLNWVRKGNIERNVEAINSSFERIGTYKPHAQKYFDITDPYIGFMVYIFSLNLNQITAKKLSTEAKIIIRQSQTRETKGKSQINVLINNLTIGKLERLCKAKNLSKASLITELIDNYNYYNKEIDAAIQKAKIGIFRIEDINPPEIISGISRATSSQSDINVDKTFTKIKNETNSPDTHPNTSTQRSHEPSTSQDDHPASITFENTHGVVEKIPDETSPKTTSEYSADPKGKLRDQDLIKIKFGHPFLYKKIK